MTRHQSFAPSTGAFVIVPEENEKSEPFSNRKQVRIFLVWWARVDCASRAEKEPGSRLPAAASCLGRHAHPAGRSPNSSSLFLPLAAVVAVAQGLSPAGLFGGSMLFESTLAAPFARQIKQKLRYPLDTGVLGGAKQPKSEPLPSGASLAAISSKVMVFVPSL